MLNIGLVLGGEFSRYCALDAAGDVTEEGTAPSTEAGFRQRFASMPPSVFALEYSPDARALYATLAGLGHTLFFSGPVSQVLKPAFEAGARAIARQNGGPAFIVTRYAADDETLLRLALSIDTAGEIRDAWYFIGPLTGGVDFAALPARPPADARASVTAGMQVRHLMELIRFDSLCVNTAPSRPRLRTGFPSARQQAFGVEAVA